MKSSILRTLFLSFIGLGVVVAAIFPFYANIFVDWKPGMLFWFVAGCVVAGIFIGVANYWLLNLILLKRLRRISEVANAISSKDLTFKCNMESEDTVGHIVESFNGMTKNLRELIGQAASLSDDVRTESNGIREVIMRVKTTAESQAERAHAIDSSIHHLANTVSVISTSSNEAAQKAHDAAAHARQGGDVVHQSIQGMDRINQSVSAVAKAVENLGHNSEQIGAIVAVIKEIAEQTNLLALNAAIEAARAGEQGRGFAVVADEVRKLAEKTTKATQQISTMIETVQQETSHTVRAMETGRAEVSDGVARAKEAGAVLSHIVAGIEQVTGMVQEIAQATRTQNQDVQAIRNHVADITGLIEEAGRVAREGADRAARLDDQAKTLDGAVKAFKLR